MVKDHINTRNEISRLTALFPIIYTSALFWNKTMYIEAHILWNNFDILHIDLGFKFMWTNERRKIAQHNIMP